MRLSNQTVEAQAKALADLVTGSELRILAGSRTIVSFIMPVGSVKGGLITWPDMSDYATQGGTATGFSIGGNLITGTPEELGLNEDIPSDALVGVRGMTYRVNNV